MIKSKHILLIALISFACLACSREDVHIHGNISGLPNGTVYLRVYEGSMRTIDTTSSIGGRFQFNLPNILPNIVYLQFNDDTFFVPLLVDGAEVSVGGNYSYPDEIQVEGTPANDAFGKYREQIRQYDIMLKAIDLDLNRLSGLESNSTVIQLTAKRIVVQSQHDSFRTQFVRANRGSLVSAFLVASTITDSTSVHVIDSLIGELEPTMADNAFLRRIHRKRNEASKQDPYQHFR